MNNQASAPPVGQVVTEPPTPFNRWGAALADEVKRTSQLGNRMVEKFGRILDPDFPSKVPPPIEEEPISPITESIRRLALELRANNDAIEHTIERCAV